MKTFKSFFLIIAITLSINTSLYAWTSSNEGVCYTLDSINSLTDSIYLDTNENRFVAACDLIILENDSLQIIAGQELMFLEVFSPPQDWFFYGIKVFGVFIAIGEKNNKITLGDKYYDFINGNVWCGIQFYNTSQYGQSIIKYCNINGAINVNEPFYGYKADIGIYCENSSPIIDHCSFSYIKSNYETGGGSAIGCRGISNPIISYCQFENLYNSLAIWCNPWDYGPDTINVPSPLILNCNIMPNVEGFYYEDIFFDVIIYQGGFLDNCYLGVNYNNIDTTLGYPLDTIGDGICNTTSTFWKKRFMNVDGVVNPRSDTLITGINETEIEILPTTTDHLVLKDCFPNPFNDFTTIEFDLSEPSQKVSLIIFDSKGNSVKSLLNEQVLLYGKYLVKWYGDNDSGVKLKEGIYFYKLTCNNKMLIKKAIVIK
jgi:hypothetical protein